MSYVLVSMGAAAVNLGKISVCSPFFKTNNMTQRTKNYKGVTVNFIKKDEMDVFGKLDKFAQKNEMSRSKQIIEILKHFFMN